MQREARFKKALEDADINFKPSLIQYGDYGFKSGLRAAKQFILTDDKPTAIFAKVRNFNLQKTAIKAIKKQGLKVPEDVAVMGFGNISFASMCDPPLTTISQPKYDLGCIAMDLLIKQIQGELKESRDIFLEYELIIRESTIK